MAERENLPAVITVQAVVVSKAQRGSLVSRGLAAIQSSKHPVLPKDNDALYLQARTEFDRRNEFRYRRKCKNRALLSDFKTFQQLANENYGKAYYPLSVLYSNGGDIEDGQVREEHYAQMALDWCSANQTNQDVELWCDLGSMYEYQNDELAVYWYRKAAEQGYIRAQLKLGDHFGLCVEDDPHHDYEEAAKWYRLAADQGMLLPN